MSYAATYLAECRSILDRLDAAAIDAMAGELADVKAKGGRIFFLGVGGSAANCSHAVNDFRKIAHIECYTPTDNVAEVTARTNDEGWDTTFIGYLRENHLTPADAVFVLSVGGGSATTSPNLVIGLAYAQHAGCRIFGIVGRMGGYTKAYATRYLLIPTLHPDRITPHTESFQSVLLHLLVTHPALQERS